MITATLAGQIVMEGFLNLRLKPWVRRLATRLIAIIPALISIIWFGESSTSGLLIFSQVVLSLQLSFAVVPLVMFTSNRHLMGEESQSLVVENYLLFCSVGNNNFKCLVVLTNYIRLALADSSLE